MYGHGLASIALCEAYGMTKDTGLAEPAQHAVNFIVYAQDPVGGGWRYTPHQPGDTSVLGWQLMALKSAHMAYLNVPPKTIKGAVNFLNSVQGESGRHVRLCQPRQRTRDDRHRPVVPDVPGLEARRAGPGARRRVAVRARPLAEQDVFQLLRHAGHAPLRRGRSGPSGTTRCATSW